MRSVRCITAIIAVLIVTFTVSVGRADAKVLQLWCVQHIPYCKDDCYRYSLTLDTEQQTVSWIANNGHRSTLPITESSTEYSWRGAPNEKETYLNTLNRGTLEEVITSETKGKVLFRYHCSLSHNAI